jgi:hypothetical protein
MSLVKRLCVVGGLLSGSTGVLQVFAIFNFGQNPLSITEIIGLVSSAVLFVLGTFLLVAAPSD